MPDSFVQKTVNFLIFYGFNIVKVYEGFAKFTEKQLNLNFGLERLKLANNDENEIIAKWKLNNAIIIKIPEGEFRTEANRVINEI